MTTGTAKTCQVCGQIHKNGKASDAMRHWVSNWQLYFLRASDKQLEHLEPKGQELTRRDRWP